MTGCRRWEGNRQAEDSSVLTPPRLADRGINAAQGGGCTHHPLLPATATSATMCLISCFSGCQLACCVPVSCRPVVSVAPSCQSSVCVPVSCRPAVCVASSSQSSGCCQPSHPPLLCNPISCGTSSCCT
ncbi:keratin-associated protein 12-3-like [Fukomys damarensis]|uniref:keratin-associated protein 12-3-like n=1 Tax=Fukomys damarensis TaxID=885580 RepID=UPI00145517B2|nr:keratin-associated protein 12-3-like [Fukomys damarensis]